MQWNYCNKLFCKSSILTWFYFAEYSWLLSHGIKCNSADLRMLHTTVHLRPCWAVPFVWYQTRMWCTFAHTINHQPPQFTYMRVAFHFRKRCGSCVRKNDVFSPRQTHSLSATSSTTECISVDQWTAATITGPTQPGEEWCHTHSYQHGRNGTM